MKPATLFKKPLLFPLLLAALTSLLFSCGGRPTLRIDYQLPAESQSPHARTVMVKARDTRGSSATLSPTAQRVLRNFTDYFTLALDQGAPEGIYELEELFRTAMGKRLERAGYAVPPYGSPSDLTLVININTFLLDYQQVRWHLKMGLDVQLLREEKVIARQHVNGEAERLQAPRKKDADALVGEIFTDVMNRIDLAALLSKA